MEMMLAASLAFCAGYLLRYFQQKKIIQSLKTTHRKDWLELIYLLNHSGKIPKRATTIGLIKLALLVITTTIEKLKSYQKEPDSIIQSIIAALCEIHDVLSLLHDQLEALMKEDRDHLRNFDYKNGQ